jgi:hypothetical protein
VWLEIASLVREHRDLLEWLAGVSLVMFVVTLAAFPLVIIQLPQDYFVRDRRRPAHLRRRHPVIWFLLTLLKNLVGAVLIMAGIAMLVLPGQGLLTILIGLTLLNFPGKYTAERRLAGRPRIARTLNRIRAAARRPPLAIPGHQSD